MWQRLLAAMPEDIRRRAGGLALALLIELLLLLMLLSLGLGRTDEVREYVPITSFDVSDDAAPEEADPQQSQAASAAAAPDEQVETDSQPQPAPELRPSPLRPIMPLDYSLPPRPTPTPTPSSSSEIGVVIRSDMAFGPVDTGPPGGPDSERVGTAPDGSPLYAARWFREPGPQELAGYLSTATSPGWGLIACRTAPNWRVEDCEIISESPAGSGIARAVQAAAWQFQVRPPRIGGQYQVGSWVRIRIDYTRNLRRR